MDSCNFKVIAEISPSLNKQEKSEVTAKIKALQKKLLITECESNTYSNTHEDNQEFGLVVFFFLELKKIKNSFCHLAYYDFLDNEEEIAV